MSLVKQVQAGFGQAESFVVSEANVIEKFAVTHPYVYAIAGFLIGWAVAAVVYHKF